MPASRKGVGATPPALPNPTTPPTVNPWFNATVLEAARRRAERTANKRTGGKMVNAKDAKDFAQETVVNLLERGDSFKGSCRPEHFEWCVTANVLNSAWRKHLAHPTDSLQATRGASEEGDDRTLEDDLAASDSELEAFLAEAAWLLEQTRSSLTGEVHAFLEACLRNEGDQDQVSDDMHASGLAYHASSTVENRKRFLKALLHVAGPDFELGPMERVILYRWCKAGARIRKIALDLIVNPRRTELPRLDTLAMTAGVIPVVGIGISLTRNQAVGTILSRNLALDCTLKRLKEARKRLEQRVIHHVFGRSRD